MVENGLTWAGLKWAFGWHAANWHPLTWISHMADCQGNTDLINSFGIGGDAGERLA
jgi:hypothetical protein